MLQNHPPVAVWRDVVKKKKLKSSHILNRSVFPPANLKCKQLMLQYEARRRLLEGEAIFVKIRSI